ncbi:MAG: bifunctional proline dehydrogenase/L-glutamate gamma-semialdehyde dehydrogenase [Verrucomicrobia bacterium]|nr:bifunctional proline dehydrogenase/L-glutamate gamma-semialdehyde dehydrogenase [Verrucomicrobiota bacterium]
MKPLCDQSLIDRAVELARVLQQRAGELQTPAERRQQAELDRMLQTPADKATLVQLTDQAFRSRQSARVAEQFTHILDVQGVPRFFNPLDRALMRGFQTFGAWLPGVAVPLVKEHMRHETANVVLPAETEHLTRHLRERSAEGVRMNLNFLGEALLGEEEAGHRLEKYLAALQLPEVEVLSVKISTLFSQINPLAREHTLRVLCERLELLYRAADRARFALSSGTGVPPVSGNPDIAQKVSVDRQDACPTIAKFVYLDMEEYRDLSLTAEAFMRTLDRRGLEQVRAGIALQAYIPDSARVQRTINDWARKRVARGGSPVTIRIVKGANMEMERVEASLRDWPQAPFKRKVETDANYKRMLVEAMRPENLAAVRVGVASHNLFDLAFGLVLAAEADAGDHVQFEMLEGMANHQRRALLEHSRNLLLYAPACRREEFLNAIGYLIRRLDENTGPDNFLRHAFRLTVDSPDWHQLEGGFREAFTAETSDAPRRTQDRSTERFDSPVAEMSLSNFRNEPDTDWSLPQNSAWAEQLVARKEPSTPRIPCVVAGEELQPESQAGVCTDPSRPGVELARYRLGTEADVNRTVACAKADPGGWRAMSVDTRSAVLGRVAEELRRARGELMWTALANGGKILSESDPEVSEAVDFVEFYRASARTFFEWPGLRAEPRGVVVVVPPWNFPIAIPCGGIAAALAAGNTVILKPASDTVLIAWELCQCFWRAGVPRTALQFLPCPGGGAGAKLVAHPDVDAVILTGGTATAQRMLDAKPSLHLFAETGGKNATIVTALSDRELAIKHVVHSAFSHSGQKCSATSLLLLEAEVYDDPQFKRMLCDAVKSLNVGSAWDLPTRVGPCIRPPSGDLETTEFFGPVLGVMRFERLEDAIEMVNATGYELTSAIHSLDDREIKLWKSRVRAGNLYINRGTTGAVVLRQPFGGMGKSCFGAGMKAGGPNYVAQFMRFAESDTNAVENSPLANQDLESLRLGLLNSSEEKIRVSPPRLLRALASYGRWWREEFGGKHDHLRLLGQDNLRRYLPFRSVHLRVNREDSLFEIIARVAAARATGARVIVSHSSDTDSAAIKLLEQLTDSWAAGIEFVEETDAQLAAAIREGHVERIRTAGPGRVSEEMLRAAAEHFVHVASEPVLAEGRVELLWYLREQSVSFDYHRYGNLGSRAGEARREPE